MKKEFNPKDAIIVFISFIAVCGAVLFALLKNNLLGSQSLFSFQEPSKLIGSTVSVSLGLLVFGILATFLTPSKYIDETNKSYQNQSFPQLLSFLFVGALFEELLFRGIIQNVLFTFLHNSWLAIIVTTLLFLTLHVLYFKKPIMLLTIIVPSLAFGWVYFTTGNLLAPFIAHFVLNLGMTLLFKYEMIKVRE